MSTLAILLIPGITVLLALLGIALFCCAYYRNDDGPTFALEIAHEEYAPAVVVPGAKTGLRAAAARAITTRWHTARAGFLRRYRHARWALRRIDSYAELQAATARWHAHRGPLPALAVMDNWEIILGWIIRAAQPPRPLYDPAVWQAYATASGGGA